MPGGAPPCVPTCAGWRPGCCPVGVVLPASFSLSEGERCGALRGPRRVFSVNCLLQSFTPFPHAASFMSIVLTSWVGAAPFSVPRCPDCHSLPLRGAEKSAIVPGSTVGGSPCLSSSWGFAQSQWSSEMAVWPLRTVPRGRCRGFTEGFRPPGGLSPGAVRAAAF